MRSRLWRYSGLDGIQATFACLQLGGMTAWAWSFDRMSLSANVIAGLAGCVAYFLNAAVISHSAGLFG